MKHVALFIIDSYIVLFSPLLKIVTGTDRMCRYEVTCSAFMKEQIRKYGMIKGGKNGLTRLLTCHPLRTYVTHL